ncbi:MAG TPA: DUF4294 domain-containing protein [Prolixibacteraceae bacterium]|nr:DUF4294 domain-containing protein [Prolixibacteraceae bacterium]
MIKVLTLTLFFLTGISFLLFLSLSPVQARKRDNGELLRDDMIKIWPFIQTVKVEFKLVQAQLELMTDPKEKEEYLYRYEEYVKKAYFNELIRLNIRQGKLLLLLIHRELGKTPFDLLRMYLDEERAGFWQKFAKFLGADLRKRYNPREHTEMERIIIGLDSLQNPVLNPSEELFIEPGK